MKVLVVGLGGVTATFRNWPERIVALALAERGHEVRAIGTRDAARPALAARRETIGKVDVQRVRSGYWPNRELAAALAAGPRPDIIHLMHPRNVLAAQVTAWARQHGIPTVYTWLGPYHDAYLVDDRERPFSVTPHYERLIWSRQQLIGRLRALRSWRAVRDAIRNYRLHWPLAAANHLVPCSEFEAQEMRRMGRQQPQTVVPLWIDLAAIDAEPRVAPPLTAPRPWLLFVGQLTPRKGYDLVLQAMPAILRRYPTATLLIVSGINHAERAEVERLSSELGIEQHIEFLGRVDDTTLINLFRACDAYLTPTRYEGFGLTLLEAMAAEAPIVASNIPVVDEIVRDGENGLLAQLDDPHSLAAATLRILDDSGLQAALRAEGRRTCELCYNPTRLTAQLEAVYHEVVNGPGEGRN